jgi:hypothetical protein
MSPHISVTLLFFLYRRYPNLGRDHLNCSYIWLEYGPLAPIYCVLVCRERAESDGQTTDRKGDPAVS